MPANNLFADLLTDQTAKRTDTDAHIDHDPEAEAEGEGEGEGEGSRIAHPEGHWRKTEDPVIWVNLLPESLDIAARLRNLGRVVPHNKAGRKVITPRDLGPGIDILDHPDLAWTTWARNGREVHVVVWECEIADDEIRMVFPDLHRVREILPDVIVHLANHAAADGGLWRDFHDGSQLFTGRTEFDNRVRARIATRQVVSEADRRMAADTGAPAPRLRAVGDVTGSPAHALIRHHLTTNTHAELIAPETTGKTGLALGLGLSIATGTSWAGESVTRGRVVFLVGEGGGDAFDARVDAWLTWHGMHRDDIAGWFMVADPSAAIGSPHWDGLAAEVAAFRPSLVIIDTRTAHLPDGADDNAVSAATTVLGALKKLRQRCGGATTLVLHHPGKQGTSGRGSQSWSDAADTRFLASRGKDGRITLTEGKQRHFAGGGRWVFTTEEVPVDHPVFDTATVIVHEDTALDAADAAKAEERAAERKSKADRAAEAEREAHRAALVDIVTKANAEGKLPTTNELVAAALKAGISRDRAREIRRALVDDGTLTEVPGPNKSTRHQVAR